MPPGIPPNTPHPSSWATTRVAPTPLKDSGRTPTSSFRAQSRNPCFPALQLGCCDYAQHDGVCRAPLPPITHTIPRHSSLLIMGNHKVAPTPLKDSGRTPTSLFRAQSRNPCFPALQLGCCDYAQHDGVCRAPLPPHHPHHSPSFLTPHHEQPQGLRLRPSKTAAEPQLRHSAPSRGIHVSLHSNLDAATTRSMTACAGHRYPPSPTPFPVIPHFSS